MSLAVIGAGGQLGHDLCQLLGPEVARLTHAEIELADPASVRAALESRGPETVVNLAAYNLVDHCEDEPQTAFAVNALGVRNLALVCRKLGYRLVHVSTDYVFGLEESRSIPYAEQDVPGPVSVYGASKLAGEYFVRSLCPDHLIVRTCGLYGHAGARGKGGNFVKTMLRLGREQHEMRVVNDQTCTPSFTQDVAQGLSYLVRNRIPGICHLTNAGQCTWYQFACEIFRLGNMDVNVMPIRSEEFAAKARRPAYSVLSTARYRSLGAPPLRTWQEALREYLAAGA